MKKSTWLMYGIGAISVIILIVFLVFAFRVAEFPRPEPTYAEKTTTLGVNQVQKVITEVPTVAYSGANQGQLMMQVSPTEDLGSMCGVNCKITYFIHNWPDGSKDICYILDTSSLSCVRH
jgi:hypothetical protein